MTTNDGLTTTDEPEQLVEELIAAGNDMTVADLLDCLASAGLVLVRSPHKAAQAYSDYILRSLETAA